MKKFEQCLELSKPSWSAAEAKSRFCELAEVAQKHGPQLITRHGKPLVVAVSMSNWKALSSDGEKPDKGNLGDWLFDPAIRGEALDTSGFRSNGLKEPFGS